MRQLTSLDAQFLALESSNQTGHVAGLAILDPSTKESGEVTFAISTGPGRPTWNLVVSNVPGPQFPLYCAGAKLLAHYPVSVITDGMGLNMTVMSYDGHMDFGIVADRDQIPDLSSMMGRLRDSLEELK
jgi:diacylglycerol O-acyltransferase